MQMSERNIMTALLVLVVLCVLGALVIQCSGKLKTSEVKTSVIERRKTVEKVGTNSIDSKLAAKLDAAGLSSKYFAGVTPTPWIK